MYQNCCKKYGGTSLHTEVKGNNTVLYCDNCRCNSEIEKDSYEYGCDDCHRKYNGWGISMQTSKRIAKEILENIGE